MTRCGSCHGEFEAKRQTHCPLCGVQRPRPVLRPVPAPRSVQEALEAMHARETKPRRRRRRQRVAPPLKVVRGTGRTRPPQVTGPQAAPKVTEPPYVEPRAAAPRLEIVPVAVPKPAPVVVTPPPPRPTPAPAPVVVPPPPPAPPKIVVIHPKDGRPELEVSYIFGTEATEIVLHSTVEILPPKEAEPADIVAEVRTRASMMDAAIERARDALGKKSS